MIWVASLAYATDPCAEPAEVQTERSAAIKKIYDDSEAEREDRSSEAESVLKRDEQRVAELIKIDKRGELCSLDDKWHAAWVLEQSDDLEVLERAYQLALETMQGHHKNGAWLVAFTFDRKRTAAGFPQAYGTQTRVDTQNHRCLIHVDPKVTDADRTKYGHKPIVEVYRKILDLNGFVDDEATLERLDRRGLYCEPVAITRRGLRNQERME